LLSYRHAFHAGNHADVLKHLCLVAALEHLVKKHKPLCYVDTHAGPGSCQLDQGHAAQNMEFESGIMRLFGAPGLPGPIDRYVQLVRRLNPDGVLETYPGSPAIARLLLPGRCRMELCELHPADFESLRSWAGKARYIRLAQQDGFRQLRALLPPVERRALVLIDPSYEVKEDYAQVVTALEGALRRFATGVYLLWYPLLARRERVNMVRALAALPCRQLQVELRIRAATSEGMYGSGMFIINPPYQLAGQLETSKETLVHCLAQDESADMEIQTRGID